MSHAMGVKCEECRAVLMDDRCPECHPHQGHGYTFIDPEQALQQWGHECPVPEPL